MQDDDVKPIILDEVGCWTWQIPEPAKYPVIVEIVDSEPLNEYDPTNPPIWMPESEVVRRLECDILDVSRYLEDEDSQGIQDSEQG